MSTNKEPETLDELIGDYKYDGVRTKEIDWCEPQGSEIKW